MPDGLLGVMGRRPRTELAGGIHHVFARGVDKQPIFRDDVDREIYLTTLGRVAHDMGWRVLAYCLMENHIHLLIETPKANLGRGMQRLHSAYALAFNTRHDRVGHLFQGRFGAVLITTDEQFWTVAAYIARNPVEASLCSEPEDWRWSSHRAAIGGPRPSWLDIKRFLAFFSGGGDARDRYAGHVAERGTEGSGTLVTAG